MGGRMSLPETGKLLLRVNDRNSIESDLYHWLYDRGVVILHARSTRHALDLMRRVHVDAVMTNLRRKEKELLNPTAGIELIRAIRETGSRVPIIMYTLEVPIALQRLVQVAGVDKVTVHTNELYAWLKSIGI